MAPVRKGSRDITVDGRAYRRSRSTSPEDLFN